MNRTLIGPSTAVCEKCLIRCEGWYEDNLGLRLRLVICPLCGNGDPQLNVADHEDESLDDDTRVLLRLMFDESRGPRETGVAAFYCPYIPLTMADVMGRLPAWSQLKMILED